MTSNTSAEIEIEVAYLVTGIPQEISTSRVKRITDIYLSDSSDLLTKLRLRQNGDTYELTKKVVVDPSDLSTQHEYTVPLTKAEFTILKGAGGREVTKDRYTFSLAGHTAELDVFCGGLEGFAIIEFEFANSEARDAFVPPACCGAEVTQEDFIAGGELAGKSYQDIETELSKFNYEPLSIA